MRYDQSSGRRRSDVSIHVGIHSCFWSFTVIPSGLSLGLNLANNRSTALHSAKEELPSYDESFSLGLWINSGLRVGKSLLTA